MNTKSMIMNIIPFIVGGIIIGSVSLLTSYFSGKAGAIFWSLPLSLISITFFLWYFNNYKVSNKITDLISATIPSLFALTGFIVIFHFSLKKYSYPVSVGLAFGFWICCALFMWVYLCPSPFNWKCVKNLKYV